MSLRVRSNGTKDGAAHRAQLWPGVLLALVLCGCGDRSNSEPAAESTVEPPAQAPAADAAAAARPENDVAPLLDQLTQTLRKYSAEKQRVPKSLDELVTAGYLPAVPSAPAGKRFAINEKRVEVMLVER